MLVCVHCSHGRNVAFNYSGVGRNVWQNSCLGRWWWSEWCGGDARVVVGHWSEMNAGWSTGGGPQFTHHWSQAPRLTTVEHLQWCHQMAMWVCWFVATNSSVTSRLSTFSTLLATTIWCFNSLGRRLVTNPLRTCPFVFCHRRALGESLVYTVECRLGSFGLVTDVMVDASLILLKFALLLLQHFSTHFGKMIAEFYPSSKTIALQCTFAIIS